MRCGTHIRWVSWNPCRNTQGNPEPTTSCAKATVVGDTVRYIPFAVLGFRPDVLYAVAIFRLFHNIWSHSNLRVSLGPLRHVIVTPDVHSWHHDVADQRRNLGAVFTIWDRLFGTLYVPPEPAAPARFGLGKYGADIPRGFFGQVAYPVILRRRSPRGPAATRT
jgi:sterol desaturase/sphingolipid hydroxylase (fatty acid hydroxylase superfamily)